jgi:asparagine synthase (glutamine-hydrolysing)
MEKDSWLPQGVRGVTAGLLNILSPQTWEAFFEAVGAQLPNTNTPAHPGDKLQKLAEVLTADDQDDMYLRLISHWQDPATVLLGGSEPSAALNNLTAQGIYRHHAPDDVSRHGDVSARRYIG